MNNVLNLRELPQKEVDQPIINNQPKLKSFRSFRHLFLTAVLLVGTAFSFVKISAAVGAPDPGHLWSEIEQTALAIAQGGTGLETLGVTGDVLIVNATGDALEYQSYDNLFGASLATRTTDNVTEGAANLYYTDARFDTRLGTKTTTDLAEGTNLYYTDARFDTRLASKDTDDLVEGANLYFTNTRARAALSGTSPISYNSGTGAISLTTVPISLGGTGQTTANASFNALAPSQTGQANKFLQTNGTNTSWTTVDKSFIGLSNVENTALSTWTGSANIANVGTIVTGSWQATPIADTYVASAPTWNAKEPGIAIGLASQYFRGDKTWATLDTSTVPENGNLYYTTARHDADFDTRLAVKTTDDLVEGAANFYYTDARVEALLASKTTDDLAEGVANFYYTDARFDASLAGKTSDDLAEGVTNKYLKNVYSVNAAADLPAGAEGDIAFVRDDNGDVTYDDAKLYYFTGGSWQ